MFPIMLLPGFKGKTASEGFGSNAGGELLVLVLPGPESPAAPAAETPPVPELSPPPVPPELPLALPTPPAPPLDEPAPEEPSLEALAFAVAWPPGEPTSAPTGAGSGLGTSEGYGVSPSFPGKPSMLVVVVVEAPGP